MDHLSSLTLKGFKSIRELSDFTLRPLNVLIGANGAGKSNLISFFRLLGAMVRSPQHFANQVKEWGGANNLLYEGAGRTPEIELELRIQTESGRMDYRLRLSFAATDAFAFTEERVRCVNSSTGELSDWSNLSSGHSESGLWSGRYGSPTTFPLLKFLTDCTVFHFHNTSATSRIKTRWNALDMRLKEDGAALGSFLLRLRESHPLYYRRIVSSIQLGAPFLDDFVLEPENGTVLLQWREVGSDLIWSPHQASDGTLRWFALMALLLQPEEHLPKMIILDEPELGLHPYAVHLLAETIRSVSKFSQVILCTQSPQLVNQFEPEDIVVVERPDRESKFRRLEGSELAEWLEDYSLGELWEKNVIGGRP